MATDRKQEAQRTERAELIRREAERLEHEKNRRIWELLEKRRIEDIERLKKEIKEAEELENELGIEYKNKLDEYKNSLDD